MPVKTTRITVEIETLTVVHGASVETGCCPDCGVEVDVVAITAQALKDPDTVAQLREWLAMGKLHCWQTADGSAQLCVKSLLQCLDSEEARSLRDLRRLLSQGLRIRKHINSAKAWSVFRQEISRFLKDFTPDSQVACCLSELKTGAEK